MAELCMTAAQGGQQFPWKHPTALNCKTTLQFFFLWSMLELPLLSFSTNWGEVLWCVSFHSSSCFEWDEGTVEKWSLIRLCLCKFREGWIKATQHSSWHFQTLCALKLSRIYFHLVWIVSLLFEDCGESGCSLNCFWKSARFIIYLCWPRWLIENVGYSMFWSQWLIEAPSCWFHR